MNRVLLKRRGKRLPARRVVHGQGAGMGIDCCDRHIEMNHVRARGRGDDSVRECGFWSGTDFEMDDCIGGTERARRRRTAGFYVDGAAAWRIQRAGDARVVATSSADEAGPQRKQSRRYAREPRIKMRAHVVLGGAGGLSRAGIGSSAYSSRSFLLKPMRERCQGRSARKIS